MLCRPAFIEIWRETHSPVSGSLRQRQNNMPPTLSFCYRQVKSDRPSSATTPVPTLWDWCSRQEIRVADATTPRLSPRQQSRSPADQGVEQLFPLTLYCLRKLEKQPDLYCGRDVRLRLDFHITELRTLTMGQ